MGWGLPLFQSPVASRQRSALASGKPCGRVSSLSNSATIALGDSAVVCHPRIKARSKRERTSFWSRSIPGCFRSKNSYVEFPQFRAHISQMTDEWTEKLRCPLCHKIGMACLSQGDDENTPTVQFATEGCYKPVWPQLPLRDLQRRGGPIMLN